LNPTTLTATNVEPITNIDAGIAPHTPKLPEPMNNGITLDLSTIIPFHLEDGEAMERCHRPETHQVKSGRTDHGVTPWEDFNPVNHQI
jgi:hypothetical protein